jgi:hypothetical protein
MTTPTACQGTADSLQAAEAVLAKLEERLQAANGHNKAIIEKRIEDAALKISFWQNKLASCIAAHPPDTPWSHTFMLGFDQLINLAGSILGATRLRLHNLSTGDHRHSTFDIAMRNGSGGYNSLEGFPKDLGQLSQGNDYYFNDVNSKSLTLKNVAPAVLPLRLEAIFETNDTEIIVNNWFDKDLTAFSISLDLNIVANGSHDSLLVICSNASTKAEVGHWYGDSEDTSIESGFNDKINEQFSQVSLFLGNLLTDYFITTDKSHFDYSILNVTKEDNHWAIKYSQRPKVGGVFDPNHAVLTNQ